MALLFLRGDNDSKSHENMYPASTCAIFNLTVIIQILPFRQDIEISAYHPRLHTLQNSTNEKRAARFPLIIHTMWKSPDSSPPAETVRWRKVGQDHFFPAKLQFGALSLFSDQFYASYRVVKLSIRIMNSKCITTKTCLSSLKPTIQST